MRTRNPWKITFIVVAILVVLALLAGLISYYGFGKGDVERRDIGNGVIVEGDNLPDGLKASLADPDATLPDALKQLTLDDGTVWGRRISQVFDVTPSGPLSSPIKAEIPVDALPAAESNHPLVAFSSPPDGSLEFEEIPVISQGVRPDGQAFVTVELSHLSIKTIFEGFTEAIGANLVKLYEFAGAEVVQEAEQPSCRNEVSSSEYLVRIDGSADALFSCLDRNPDSGKLELHVVNNRRYALSLKPQGMQPAGSGEFKLDLTELYKRWATDPIIRPREEAVFVLDDLKDGQQASLSSDVNSLSFAATSIENIAGVVMSSAGDKRNTPESDAVIKKNILQRMTDLRDCGNEGKEDIPGNLAKLMASCLTDEAIDSIAQSMPKFVKTGAKAAMKVLRYVVAVMDVSSLTRAWSNYMADSRNGRAKQTLVVMKPDRVGQFFGKWTLRRGQGLSTIDINADRTATFTYDCLPGDGVDRGCGMFAQTTRVMIAVADVSPDTQSDGLIATYRSVEFTGALPHQGDVRSGDQFRLTFDSSGRIKLTPIGRPDATNTPTAKYLRYCKPGTTQPVLRRCEVLTQEQMDSIVADGD